MLGELHQIAVLQKGTKQLAVRGDESTSGKNGGEKLFGGLLWRPQVKTPLNITP